MDIQNRIALVTGANRGIGRALTEALLRGGAERVYAGARDVAQLAPLAAAHGGRLIPLALDVTDRRQVAAAAERAGDVDLLVNNAGVLASGSLLASSEQQLEQDMSVNYLGTLWMARNFVPALAAKQGALVNLLTVVSLAPMPALGGYSASKAAAWSMTAALRAELAPRGVRVFAVFPGPIDTDMTRGIDLPKTSATDAAAAIVAGLQREELDIYPDPMSQSTRLTWQADPRELLRQFAGASG
jgi:NAD(P)-dependent dehydrogenase (short-subunit alcohol dehydrogenase family)